MQTSSCHIPRVCQFLLIIVLTLMMFTPAYVKADMSAVAGGNYHTIAIRDDGTVWAWGSNGYGQLGDGTTATYKKIPVQVSGLMDVTAIAGGEAHTVALKSDDTVWTWGKNNKGQLGDGSTVSYSKTPVQVSGLTSVIEIASVFNHTIALKSNSTVWTWGDNGEGQLGDGTTTYRSTPVQVSGLSDATAIAAGYWHSISLKSDGTAWAWGYNFYGQLGDGTKTDSNTPVQVSGLNNVIAIAGRSRSTAALKSDGTVWSWGSNSNGQLGDGSTVSYSKTPVQASGLTDVIAIACGAYHAVALRDDATVWAWGSNEYGQLGDGTTTDRNTPVEVSGLTNVIAISCGNRHSIALKSDGTVWAWGRNNKSQLGDGTTEDRYTPVKVVFSDFSTTTTTTPDDTTTTTVPDDITTSTTIPEGAFHLGDVNRDDDITSIDAAMTMQIVDGTLSSLQ